MKEGKEVVLCASIKLADGRIFSAPRHCDCIRNAKLILGDSETERVNIRNASQGFITSKNRFLDRSIAYDYAIVNEQSITERIDRKLYSEDLY